MTTENLLFFTSAKFEIISLDKKRDSVLIIKIKAFSQQVVVPVARYRPRKYIVITSGKLKMSLLLEVG